MAIIISKNGNNAVKIEESNFALEDKLQEYVKNNPDIVPIYDISTDARLLILAREFGTHSGPIDALGTDQEGNIYIIETKLYKNPDKRTVLAQALDYGASLWRHSGDSTDFIEAVNKKVLTHFDISLPEKLQDFFSTEDSRVIIDAMARNVTSGNIKFVILMDRVEDRLKDLVTYVNQNSRFNVYAVDLQYYKHDEFEIIIPKLYGSEVKKEVIATDESLRFDNQKIISWLEELSLPYLSIDWDKTAKTFLRFTTKTLDEILPARNDTAGGWNNGNAYYYEIQTDKSGSINMYLSLNSNGLDDKQAQGQRAIMDFVNKYPSKPDWKWFRAAKWDLDTSAYDASLQNRLNEVLTKEIPAFEKDLTDFISSR